MSKRQQVRGRQHAYKEFSRSRRQQVHRALTDPGDGRFVGQVGCGAVGL